MLASEGKETAKHAANLPTDRGMEDEVLDALARRCQAQGFKVLRGLGAANLLCFAS